jgi:hypothetical protein
MIRIVVAYCACCGEKLCSRCGSCHEVLCEERVARCRRLLVVHRRDRHVVSRGRRLPPGAQRRFH